MTPDDLTKAKEMVKELGKRNSLPPTKNLMNHIIDLKIKMADAFKEREKAVKQHHESVVAYDRYLKTSIENGTIKVDQVYVLDEGKGIVFHKVNRPPRVPSEDGYYEPSYDYTFEIIPLLYLAELERF